MSPKSYLKTAVLLTLILIGTATADSLPTIPVQRPADPLPDGALARYGASLLRHGDGVRCFAFSHDGKRLVSGAAARDATLRIWDVATGREMLRFKSEQGSVSSVAFSPDDHRIASGGGRGVALRLWNADNGQLVRQFNLNPRWSAVHDLTFSPDGSTIATGNTNSSISFFDVATGREIGTISSPADAAPLLAYAPDAKTLLSAGTLSKKLRLWNVADGSKVYDVVGPQVTTHPAFSPDGKSFAAGCADGTIRIWSAPMGTQVGSITAHTKEVTAVAYTPDGNQLVSTSLDQTISLWSIPSGNRLKSAPTGGTTPQLTLSPDGHTVAVRTRSNSAIRFWDTATGQWRLGDNHDAELWLGLTFSPDGTRLVTQRRKHMDIWDTRTQKLIRTVPFDIDASEIACAADAQHIAARHMRALSPTHIEMTIRLWDLNTGSDTLQFRGDAHGGRLSPNCKKLATWHPKQPVLIRSLDENTTLELPFTAPKRIFPVTYSADSRSIALTEPGGTVHLFDVETAQPVGRVTTGIKNIAAITLSPNNQLLACTPTTQTPTSPTTISVFLVEPNQPLRSLEGHKGDVRLLAFSPDNRLLATAGYDQTIRLWNLATGDEIRRFKDTGNRPLSMAFAPDGKSLVTTMSGGQAYKWPTTPN